MKILIALLLLSGIALTEEKQTAPPFVFAAPKAACTLVDGKLILSKRWPLGSWEECANGVLLAAQQIAQQRDTAMAQLNELKAQQIAKPKPPVRK